MPWQRAQWNALRGDVSGWHLAASRGRLGRLERNQHHHAANHHTQVGRAFTDPPDIHSHAAGTECCFVPVPPPLQQHKLARREPIHPPRQPAPPVHP
eukprot:scaffold370289_cov27-Prasinocladus_malaysianus.AAC.1